MHPDLPATDDILRVLRRCLLQSERDSYTSTRRSGTLRARYNSYPSLTNRLQHANTCITPTQRPGKDAHHGARSPNRRGGLRRKEMDESGRTCSPERRSKEASRGLAASLQFIGEIRSFLVYGRAPRHCHRRSFCYVGHKPETACRILAAKNPVDWFVPVFLFTITDPRPSLCRSLNFSLDSHSSKKCEPRAREDDSRITGVAVRSIARGHTLVHSSRWRDVPRPSCP